jgi:hypothetical protein
MGVASGDQGLDFKSSIQLSVPSYVRIFEPESQPSIPVYKQDTISNIGMGTLGVIATECRRTESRKHAF